MLVPVAIHRRTTLKTLSVFSVDGSKGAESTTN